MRYRTLTRSSVRVSEISLGTGDNAGGMVYGTPREQTALVTAALELGINLFDTSPAYGKGVAETNLGRVLREVAAGDALVATKVKIMPHEFDRIRERTLASIDESLRRLGREHVDVVLIHNPCGVRRDPDDAIFVHLPPEDIIDEMLPSLLEARAAGKVRALGLACDHVDIPGLRRVLATGEFEVINAVYHLLNPSAATATDGVPEQERYDGMFAAAAEFNADVAVISPLAGGALTSQVLQQGAEGLHELSRGWFRQQLQSPQSPLSRARRFEFLQRAGEQTLPEAAYRFLLANPRVATVIGGFSDARQIAEAANASDRGALSIEDCARIEQIHRQGF